MQYCGAEVEHSDSSHQCCFILLTAEWYMSTVTPVKEQAGCQLAYAAAHASLHYLTFIYTAAYNCFDAFIKRTATWVYLHEQKYPDINQVRPLPGMRWTTALFWPIFLQ